MATNVIKEFLVAIGFKTDNDSLRKFTDIIGGATKVLSIFTAVAESAGISVTTAIGAIANSMERLYYASKRTGASVESIQSFAFAAGQMGSSVQSAQSSLEAFSYFLRSSPGAISVVRSLGVTATDTAGMLEQLGEAFQHMPFYRALAYGRLFGIDYNTLIALTNGLGNFSREYQAMYKATGMNGDQAARGSREFMNQLRLTVAALELLAQKVATDLVGSVGQDVKKFRDAIVANFGPVSAIIETVIHAIVWLADEVTRMIVRSVQFTRLVVDWFNQLSTSAKGAIEAFGAVLIAWRLLSAGFMATPLGLVLSALTALLLLFDDFKTWQEGGRSLIDWKKWKPDLDAFSTYLHKLGDGFGYVADKIGTLNTALIGLAALLLGRSLLGGLGSLLGGSGAAAAGAAGGAALAGGRGVLGKGIAGAGLLWYLLGGEINKEIDETGSANLWDAVKNVWGGAVRQQKESLGYYSRGVTGGERLSSTGTARQAMQFFISRGYSLAQAAGIVANLNAESNLYPGTVGDNGEAYGVAQWHPDRQKLIEAHFGKSLQDMSFEEQLGAVDWEMTEGQEQMAGGAIRASQDAGQAAMNMSLLDLRPAGKSQEAMRRAQLAQELYARSLGWDLAPGPGGAGGGASVVINQKTDINVAGTSDPMTTANRVSTAQRGVNQDLVRNLQGVTR